MMDPVSFVYDTLNTIWNQKMVGAIYELFVSGIRVNRSCREELYGREALMIDIIERLAAFPDLRLTIENVIWQGSDEQGYRVSIRMTFTGHNLGVSRYGAATYQEIQQAVLMNGLIVDKRFVELWIAEDERSLVEQLGYDLIAAIHALEAMETFIGKPFHQDVPAVMGEIQRQETLRVPVEKLDAIQLSDQTAVREVLSALWNGRQIGLCRRFYREDFTCHWASNRHLEGLEDYQAVVLAQLAAFPDLTFHVDDVIEQNRKDGWHVAVNWTMLGTHTGPSVYGRPSGKRVHLTGISQYLIEDQQFVAERTEWNEFQIMQKIMERPVVLGADAANLSTSD